MSIISCNHVSFSYSSRVILNNISFTCEDRDRLCIVGPNGAGKTTLLRIIRHELEPDAGTVSSPEWHNVGDSAVTINDLFTAATAYDRHLLDAFNTVTMQLADNPSNAELSSTYDDVLAQLTQRDSWSLEARISDIAHGLQLDMLDFSRPMLSLSPGQQARAEMAAILLQRPEALILDEPTNHIDAQAREFLIETVSSWPGAVLFTSHDRDFIERISTAVLDLDTGPFQIYLNTDDANGIVRCNGAYSDYMRAKEDAKATHIKLHEQQEAQRSKLTAHRRASEQVTNKNYNSKSEQGISTKFFADRAQTVSTRRKSDDDRRLEALAASEIRKPRYEGLSIVLPHPTQRLSGVIVSARNFSITKRLAPVSFSVNAGDHLLLTGPNGSGKSTLMSSIHARDGLNAQSSAFVPQSLPQPVDELITEQVWTNGIGQAGKGFLHPQYWFVGIKDLSDGNKRRAQLALALASAPAVLLIDEPTNYLNLDTIESLEAAMQSWEGTLIISSHDQWLIKNWAGRRLTIHPVP